MKRFFIFFLLMSSINNHIKARIGCRDNSWHLQKKYDYKEDHAVVCHCPCPEKIGRCPQCQHYHEAKPWIIIKSNGAKNVSKKYLFNQNMQPVIKKLLAKYHRDHESKSEKI